MSYENWIAVAESVKGHKLRRNDDGCVDGFVCDSGLHNGPGCETCGDSWCEHCTKPEDIDACDGGVELQAVRAKARIRDAAPELLEALTVLVEEFGCTIEQYHRFGPHWTQKDGNETFDVGVVLDRAPLIDAARAAIAKALGEGQ